MYLVVDRGNVYKYNIKFDKTFFDTAIKDKGTVKSGFYKLHYIKK
jgi:hypothetical protein